VRRGSLKMNVLLARNVLFGMTVILMIIESGLIECRYHYHKDKSGSVKRAALRYYLSYNFIYEYVRLGV
jgi:hypothetical protein